MAALGGARHVTSVDLSSTYMDWAKRNFEQNNIALKEHNFIVQSALEYLEKSQAKFDLIFLDPPTFSNSKKMSDDFEVEKDQLFLITNCLRMLADGGVLYFSNNKRKFKLSPEVLTLCQSQGSITDITEKTIPLDFRDQKVHHCFKITKKTSR